jgi:type IV secretory pathway VirB4 component|tara:strand:- start:661 stop:1296 length:636 start_codon:yes stop_codon:yes gene_type:complete
MAKSKTTQEFIEIKEVRDGVVVLKDGSLKAILMTSSLNFMLKSADEQASTLFQFQNFLNSLDFSVQIFIQSRDLDIRPYITLLEESHKAQVTELMRVQIREYIEFVKKFTEGANIMSKSFFVVVSYTPSIFSEEGGIVGSIIEKTRKGKLKDKSKSFEENLTQLEQRTAVVEQGLMRTGIRVARLGTEEMIELLYKMFNPGELEKPIPLNK